MTPWVLINRQTKVAVPHDLLVDMAEMITVISCGVEPGVGFALHDPDGWDHGALCRAVQAESDIQPGERVMDLLDPDAAVAGALAFHEMDSSGKPAAHLFPALEDTLLDITISASHEIFEAEGDGDCDKCIVGQDGIVRCAETCDPVESTSFDYVARSGKTYKCANYVLPRYFTGGTGKLDRLNQITYSGQILPGGYQIIFANGQWTQTTNGQKRGYRRRLDDLGLGRLETRKRQMPTGPAQSLLDSIENFLGKVLK